MMVVVFSRIRDRCIFNIHWIFNDHDWWATPTWKQCRETLQADDHPIDVNSQNNQTSRIWHQTIVGDSKASVYQKEFVSIVEKKK